MVGQPDNSDVGLPHVSTLRTARVHRRVAFLAPLSHRPPRASPCGRHLVFVARCSGFLVRESPCPLRVGGSLLVVFPFPPVRLSSSVASVLCCLPGVRPSLLAASESTQDPNPVHAYGLRCLILLTALRALPVHPACCIHSRTDAKTSTGLPFPGPLLSSATCRTSVLRHWTSWFLPSSPTRV